MKLEDLTEDLLDRFEEVFASCPGASPVTFDLSTPDGAGATLEIRQRVRLSDELLASIRELCGSVSTGVEIG
jgi:hypothetical protein